MSNSETSGQKQFYEWMVTKALSEYLDEAREHNERMKWLFSLDAETGPGVSKPLHELCGFDWDGGRVTGRAEVPFGARGTDMDMGEIPPEEFNKRFHGYTPDFRYWEKGTHRQLIIEAKGTLGPGKSDGEQAERYFNYLRDTGYNGAVIYFVPTREIWFDWLQKIAGGFASPFGVVDWKVKIAPWIAGELLRVAAESVAQASDLLKTALSLQKPGESGRP
jgi:hypothetical protein